MELNIKFDEKMLVEVANRVLDEYEYNGKTIREWADLIAHPKTNADSIRAKNDEELAEWFRSVCAPDHSCAGCKFDQLGCTFDDWLKQEVCA